jgi:hypothetical protein
VSFAVKRAQAGKSYGNLAVTSRCRSTVGMKSISGVITEELMRLENAASVYDQ